MKNNTNIAECTDFNGLKRRYEAAYAVNPQSDTTSAALQALSTAIAHIVINTCNDPQRKATSSKTGGKDKGQNPVLLDIKRGIEADTHLLANTAAAAAKATRIVYDRSGDPVTVVADKAAYKDLGTLISKTLTDGSDLIQTAAAVLWEQSTQHAGAPGWLDAPYTTRKLSRRVYTRLSDSAAYRDVETTPLHEAYLATSRAARSSSAVRTDPTDGHTYIDAMTSDGLDTIYYRLQKWMDLGGNIVTGAGTEPGGMPAGLSAGGHGSGYTADMQTLQDYNTIIKQLNLTSRQATIVRLRMQDRGYKQIGTYLGVSHNAVINAIHKIQAKAEKIGFTPEMWKEMTGRAIDTGDD